MGELALHRWFRVAFSPHVPTRASPKDTGQVLTLLLYNEVLEVEEVRGGWLRIARGELRRRGLSDEVEHWTPIAGSGLWKEGFGELLKPVCAPPQAVLDLASSAMIESQEVLQQENLANLPKKPAWDKELILEALRGAEQVVLENDIAWERLEARRRAQRQPVGERPSTRGQQAKARVEQDRSKAKVRPPEGGGYVSAKQTSASTAMAKTERAKLVLFVKTPYRNTTGIYDPVGEDKKGFLQWRRRESGTPYIYKLDGRDWCIGSELQAKRNFDVVRNSDALSPLEVNEWTKTSKGEVVVFEYDPNDPEQVFERPRRD